MKRILLALAALTLTAAPALADDELAEIPHPQVYKLHRYAFDQAGRRVDEMTALGCVGGHGATVRAHRTKGDIAAAVFTGGWYTPVHVTVECPASPTAARY